MAAVVDADFISQGNFRAAVTPLDGNGSQRTKGIGGSHRSGGQLDTGSLLGQVLPQALENLIFQGGEPILGGEDLVFQFL